MQTLGVHTILREGVLYRYIMKSNHPTELMAFLGLSIATSPFIFSILFLYLLSEFMTEFGKASEEIFRSERLPVLNFPNFER